MWNYVAVAARFAEQTACSGRMRKRCWNQIVRDAPANVRSSSNFQEFIYTNIYFCSDGDKLTVMPQYH